MSKQQYDWIYQINGLFPDEIKLDKEFWIKDDEVLIVKRKNGLFIHILGGEMANGVDEKLNPFLWICNLLSENTPRAQQGGGSQISSSDELGKNSIMREIEFDPFVPDDLVADIEKFAPEYLKTVRRIHDKYRKGIQTDFLAVSLEFLFESKLKSIYSNEGFLHAMISLESMFQEGQGEIGYRMALRAAFLLGLTGMDPELVFTEFKNLYGLRSKLIHAGASSNTSDRRNALKYAKVTLKIFLILCNHPNRSKDKRKLLKEIDLAILNQDKRESLQSEINNGLKDFALNIPESFKGMNYFFGY